MDYFRDHTHTSLSPPVARSHHLAREVGLVSMICAGCNISQWNEYRHTYSGVLAFQFLTSSASASPPLIGFEM